MGANNGKQSENKYGPDPQGQNPEQQPYMGQNPGENVVGVQQDGQVQAAINEARLQESSMKCDQLQDDLIATLNNLHKSMEKFVENSKERRRQNEENEQKEQNQLNNQND